MEKKKRRTKASLLINRSTSDEELSFIRNINLTKDRLLFEFKIDIFDDMKMSLNKVWGGVHYRVRSNFRNIWHEEVPNQLSDISIPKIKNKVHIHFEYLFKTRYLDASNCALMNKVIEDSLVEMGVLGNDTNQFVCSMSSAPIFLDKKVRLKMECDFVIVRIYNVE